MPKQDVINLLEPAIYCEEVFYRLTHEVNKVYFQLQTVRKIFNYQHAHSLVDALLEYGCFILGAAKLRVAELIGQLLEGRQLPGVVRLGEFLRSKYQTQILDRLYKARNLCARMEGEVRGCFRFMYYIKKLGVDSALELKRLPEGFHEGLLGKFLSYFFLNFSNLEYLKVQE